MHAKIGDISFGTFPFIHAFFSTLHNMLALMLDPQYKGLGWSFNMLASKKFSKLQVHMIKKIVPTPFLCI
jgi:hypothetical protein